MNDTGKISPLLQVAENDNSQSTSVNRERGEKRTDDDPETKTDSPTAPAAPESTEGAEKLTQRDEKRLNDEKKREK